MTDSTRNPIQTYALTVCFTSLLAGTVFFGIAAYDLVQMNYPEFTNPYAHLEGQEEKNVLDGVATAVVASTQFRHSNAQHVVYAKQSLASNSIALILCVGMFAFHWRLAKRYEK